MKLHNRRNFMKVSGMSAAAITLSPRFAFAGPPTSSRQVRLGVIGGGFGLRFYFNEHPNVHVEAVSDLRSDRRKKLMETYQCEKSYESLSLLLKDPKVEAVAIFTPAPDHAAHVIESLNAGKHVLCAVPAAMSIEECYNVMEAVNRTGLKYMMAETSRYRSETITAKKMYEEGQFGNIFSSAAQYYHPGIEELAFDGNGVRTWRHGFPPLLYPTHCTAFLIAVTGERLSYVNGIGWGDNDPILQDNVYNNPFWNGTAFFQTNKQNAFNVEVAWKGALAHCERGEWRGDKMSYYMEYKNEPTHVVYAGKKMTKDDGGFTVARPELEPYDQETWWETELLPKAMQHDSGHGGSHTFITHEYISAIVEDREPEVNIYEALAYTAPGIIAHASALNDGEHMVIPNFDKY